MIHLDTLHRESIEKKSFFANRTREKWIFLYFFLYYEKNMFQLTDYEFTLPEHLIAETACHPAHNARLMVIDRAS